MNSERMDVAEAWRALGEDPEEVIRNIRSRSSIEARVAAAEEALARAERLAKVLSGIHHPDKNPGDESSGKRFTRVQKAIESIRSHTADLKNKASQTKMGSISDGPKIVFK